MKSKLFQEELDKRYPQQKKDLSGNTLEASDTSDISSSEIQLKHEPVIKEPEQVKPEIPPRPVMPADAKAYPKLSKIYKELNQHNDIIFEAEKERNNLEEQRDNLKGFAKLTKRGELQGKIYSKNEQIDILKKGLKGIVWRYGYQTVQDFYKSYHASASAYSDYRSKIRTWESTYGISKKPKEETITERMERYQKEKTEQHYKPNYQKKEIER